MGNKSSQVESLHDRSGMAPLLPNGSNNNTSNDASKKSYQNNDDASKKVTENQTNTQSNKINHYKIKTIGNNGKERIFYRPDDGGYRPFAPKLEGVPVSSKSRKNSNIINYFNKDGTFTHSMALVRRNKGYTDPDLKEKMSHIKKDTIDYMIDKFKEEFKDNREVSESIIRMSTIVSRLGDNPSQDELKQARKSINAISHYEKVERPLLAPLAMIGSALVASLSLFECIGELSRGGTRRKRLATTQRR